MHPYLSGLMAEAHREDLLREADQHRLVMQARAARPRHGLAQWQAALAQVGNKVRLLAKPAPAASVAYAPQPVCCPA
jgi:hypothetical protein